MRRITLMFLCLLGCSGDSDDESTTTQATVTMTPGPTTPGETTAADTTAATDLTASTGLPTPTSTGDDPATSASMTTGPMTTPPETTDDVTTADDTTTGPPPVDCNAPPDCNACWICAKTGPCKAAYDACALEAFCIPSLTCLESQCTPDGLQPDCASTCCMSCANLGTCDGVNGALACILPMCAAHCGQSTCGG